MKNGLKSIILVLLMFISCVFVVAASENTWSVNEVEFASLREAAESGNGDKKIFLNDNCLYLSDTVSFSDSDITVDLNGLDRILLKNYLVQKIKSDSINLSIADVNLDSKVDSLDHVYLRNIITGKIG